MNLLKLKLKLTPESILSPHSSQTPNSLSPPHPHFLSLQPPSSLLPPRLHFEPKLKLPRFSNVKDAIFRSKEESFAKEDNDDDEEQEQDLSLEGDVYNNTLRLVECSMFAALSGLAYFLSNSLGIENYFGCFFALPIVISSMRWRVAVGRKTMVATAMLLLVLSGPVKALTYLLMHGLLGFTMGSLWRLGANWGVSIFLCTLVRAVCLLGYVLVSSFLIRENILELITVTLHASLSFIFTTWGINTVPSMEVIYAIFGSVLLLNAVTYVFLLHILYSVFLTRLGMKASLNLPRWLQKAI